MLEYLTLILVCQLAGELVVTTIGAPLPGPVVGMVLLFLFLLLKGAVPEPLGQVSGALLNNLSLLFVPAGVGARSMAFSLRAPVEANPARTETASAPYRARVVARVQNRNAP